MLVPGFADTSVDPQGWSHKAVVDLANSVVHVTYNLHDLFRVPHGVLELARLAALALLTVELEHDTAGVGAVVELEPEHHAPLHRSPAVAAILAGEPDFGAVLEGSPAVPGRVEGGHEAPYVREVLREQTVELAVPDQLHSLR